MKTIKIEVKKINITKSIIEQMEYLEFPPVNSDYDILGWIIWEKEKFVLIKYKDKYYRTIYINEVYKDKIYKQLPTDDGYVYGEYTHVSILSTGRKRHDFLCFTDEENNLKLYANYIKYKAKVDFMGQIYY